MYLIYDNVAIGKFTEIVDDLYTAEGFLEDSTEFKKYKDKLKMSSSVSILKNSKHYKINVESAGRDGIEFTWAGENPFDLSIADYINGSRYNKDIDFSKAEEKLGFALNEELKEFYRKADFTNIYGFLKGQQIAETEKWGRWFEDDVNVKLFGIDDEINDERIEGFIQSNFEDWTGGYDFGKRIWIGELEDRRGSMLIVFNNDNGNVEWIDSEYGCFGNLEEDPNGILSTSIGQLISMLDNNQIRDIVQE